MNQIQLTAEDHHSFNAYVSGSAGSLFALVVLQEIFGVNRHIRSVADRFAREGFFTVAPALFDRVQTGVELEYNPDGLASARSIAAQLEPDQVLKDIAAAIAYARGRIPSGKVGVVGYCLGGTYAWLSATRLAPDAAVGYYGSKIAQFSSEIPACPVLLHFGSEDKGIPLSDVEKIRQAQPGIPVHVYHAGHGFNRDGSAGYSEPATTLALTRSLEFLKSNLAP